MQDDVHVGDFSTISWGEPCFSIKLDAILTKNTKAINLFNN